MTPAAKPGRLPEGTLRDIETQTLEAATQVVAANGLPYFPLAASFSQEGKRWYLRLDIDRTDQTPVQVEDCERLSRLLDPVLDELPPLRPLSYVLELSSPGVFRELTNEREFAFYRGRAVSVQAAGEKKAFEALLVDYRPESHELLLELPHEGQKTVEWSPGKTLVSLNPPLTRP